MSDKTIVIRLVARANAYTAEMRRAGAETAGFAVQVSRGAQQAGGAVKALGTASAIAGKLMVVGIGGAMAVSAKAAIDFESSLAGVSKTVDFTGTRFENAASPINAFGDALRALSLRIPVSVGELARIAEAGGQLGVNPENLIEFTETMAALGVSTNMSAEEAATGLARFANIMGTSHGDFDVLGSIIVELGNNLATTEGEILTFATRIASAGQVIGASEADILAISAALSSLGVPAERGGTAIQRVFVDMANAVANGGANLTKFADVAGVSAEDFATAFTERPGEAFEMFIRGLDNITKSGGNVFQTLDNLNLNQVRTAQVLLAAAGGADLVAESLAMANEEAKANNALTEESGRRYATTESQIQMAVNAFNDLRIEVGNLLLGTGGITYGIDALAAFFGIIKDNLDTIGSFVSGLLVLGGLKLGQVFMSMGGELIKTTRNLKGASTAVRTMGVAAASLNLAILGATAAAGILFAIWADGALKAAQFRQITRTIAQDLEDGKDAAEAIVNAISGQEFGGFMGMGGEELFSEETVKAIQTVLGLSPKQFIQGILEGRDLIGEAGIKMDAISKSTQQLLIAQGKIGKQGAFADMQSDVLGTLDALDQANEIIGGIRTARIIEMTSAFLEAGYGVSHTTDELHLMAGAILDLTNLSATNAQGLALAFGNPFADDRPSESIDKTIQNLLELPKHWTDVVTNMLEGEEILEGVFSGLEDLSTSYRDSVKDMFLEVSESIRGGFPAWDEYEQATSLNLDKVIAAQDLYLKDVQTWVGIQAELIEGASEATLAYLDGLDMPTKGALARLFENDRAAFDEFIASLNANFSELEASTNDTFNSRLPLIMSTGIDNGIAGVMAVIETLDLDGAPAAQAFAETFNQYLVNNGLHKMFTDNLFGESLDPLRAMFRNMGADFAGAILAGLIAGMDGNFNAVGDSVTRLNDRIKTELGKQWESQSPSKWMIRFFRDDVLGGAAIGVNQGIPQLTNLLNGLPQQALQPIASPIVNVQGGGGSSSRTVNINHPTTNRLREDLRLATVMVGSASEYGG